MPKIAFTDLTVRSLPVGTHLDLKLPRFGIRVGKNRRTWIVLQGARSDKKKLGTYPAMPLAAARRAAFLALGSPYQPSMAPSFPEALDQFLAQTHWKPRSHYQIRRTLRRHFHWQKALDKITHHDVASVIDSITAKSEAAHALKDIKAFFNWCVPRYIPSSPCNGLKTPQTYTPRTRLISDEEIKAIWLAANELGHYGLQIKRLIVSGQRCNQIFRLKEEWVDRKNKVIVWPPEVMKGNKQHTIPYGPLMETLLDEFPIITNQGKQKRQLDELASVQHYTLHDIRKFFSSAHRRLHTPIDVTECLLSHVSGTRSEIQRIYDLYDRMPEMRQAVEKYEDWLKSIL
jgi:integrase